ncbi:hypothetical protein V1507DRAFT_153402 [Lipomyces tetrasporus]
MRQEDEVLDGRTSESLSEIESDAPFDIGFPLSLLFEDEGSQKCHSRMTSKDIPFINWILWRRAGLLRLTRTNPTPAKVRLSSKSSCWHVCSWELNSWERTEMHVQGNSHSIIEWSSILTQLYMLGICRLVVICIRTFRLFTYHDREMWCESGHCRRTQVEFPSGPPGKRYSHYCYRSVH